MKRNREFDRPYWDVPSKTERYQSVAKIQQAAIFMKDPRSISDNVQLKARGSRIGVSTLFTYPKIGVTQSSSASDLQYEASAVAALNRGTGDHKLKRNEYSEYTERRIRFGLKF